MTETALIPSGSSARPKSGGFVETGCPFRRLAVMNFGVAKADGEGCGARAAKPHPAAAERKGTLALLSPVAAWKLGDGYIAFYLHKNYEMLDGEGDSIQISAVAIDASGKALHAIPAASSWYEYEGSIRIRDFLFLGGEFVTIEEVFDPRHRDESGNVLDYLDAPEASVIQKHQIPF